MAIFPALTPSSRTFTPGRHPHSEIPTLDGLQTRVRTSNVVLEQRLRLAFVALTEAQMLSIRSHYNTQQGRFLSFSIPDSLLSGMTTPANFTPTGYSWIYAGAPQVEDIPGTQRYTVNVELITVPPEGANVNGAEFDVSIGLAAGIATNTVNVTGAALTVTASVVGGTVANNTSAGLDLTIPTSMTSGTATGGAGGGDPNYSSVSLLLHMDGTNGSTTFADNSVNTFTVTAGGNAQISTTQSKFGGASTVFDGSGDGLSIGQTTAFGFGTSAFTVEAFIFPTVNAAAGGTTIFDFRNSPLAPEPWTIYTQNTGAGNFAAMYHSIGATYVEWGGAGQYLALNQWHHIALVSDGTTFKLFVNGVQFTVSAGGAAVQNLGTSKACRIGIANNGVASPYTGYIDEVRITKGVARYSANFTPPTAAFPNS